MTEDSNLKKKVFSGMIWRMGERITAQLVTFIISVILARIISPDDYGAIAMVMVFINIANIFVVNGFGSSLIQGKDVDNVDFSSVFYFNIAFSALLYIILYLAAPMIASFYGMEILCPVLRILGLRLILAGVNSVQQAYVSKNMLFKKFFWSTLFGTVLSGIVGLIMALNGMGIWALVGQYLVNTTTDTIVLWITVRWRPQRIFSIQKLKKLFSYGWKLLCSGLLFQGTNEIANLIIGKQYTSADLAYYTRGNQIPSLIVNNVNTSISSVLFPALSKKQYDINAVQSITRRSIQVTSYIMIPLLLGVFATADQLINCLLTEKWAFTVPYLRLYCLYYMIQPIQTANLEAIKAIGRSDVSLKLEILKRSIYLVILLACVPFGVLVIAVGNVISSYIRSVINSYPNKKLINYSFAMQLADLAPAFFMSGFMCAVVMLLGHILKLNSLIELLILVPTGGLIYIGLSKLFKVSSYTYILDIVKDYINGRKA